MNKDLYRVYCDVDNGCRHERYEMYVSASSQKKAIKFVEDHWNSQYDTTVKVTGIDTMPFDDYGILCIKQIY